MDNLFTTFLLFLAAIVAILTYLLIPMVSAATLVMAAAIALAIGVWWHWTQFAVDYRTATWPEQLRSYASYFIVLFVILASYGFYTFAWSGSSLQNIAMQTKSAVRNVGRTATNASVRSLTAASNALFSEGEASAANALEATAAPANAAAAVAPAGALAGLNIFSNSGNAKKNSNFLF